MTISRSVLLAMRNVSDKIYRENQNTFLFNTHFPDDEIIWRNTVTARKATDGTA
jgi:hypothetical protein